MKRIFTLLFLVCCTFIVQHGWAQQRRMQRIESLKVAFISQRLDLTPQEAQKFWPVYNQYENEMQQLRQQRKQNQMNVKHADSASDAAATQSLNNELSYEEDMVAIRKKYKDKFSRVLPPQKVVLLYQAEKEFTNQLIKQLKARRKQ